MIETERLILRQWRNADRPPFAAMNADPEVMRFFGFTRSRAETDRLVDRLARHVEKHGFGFYALERKADGAFLGFTGLEQVDFEAAFTPAVEIGWRLARPAWGHGYATEAARAALAEGFTTLGLPSVVSFAVTDNWRSRRVMERIGMRHEPLSDFDHPLLSAHSPLRRHAFYRVTAAEWRSNGGKGPDPVRGRTPV